jgi:hypothetical protein
MIKNSLVEGAYLARKPCESTLRTPSRLSPAPAFIAMVLMSLGLWWAVWIAVSSLVSG